MTRQPTIDEAVEILLRTLTKGFRRAQLAEWRHQYGDEFAGSVKAKVSAKWGKK